MYHPHKLACTLTVVLAGLAVSCHRKQPAPPIPARVVIPKSQPAKEPPKPLPQAPKIATSPPENPPVLVEVAPTPPAPKPSEPPPPTKKGRASRKGKAADPKPVEAAQTKPLEPATAPTPSTENPSTPPNAPAPALTGPRLAPMLTADQTKEYKRKIDGALDRAKANVVIISGKALNNEQKATIDNIKSFVAQAEQTREQDLVSAVSLAERADLLARDLLDRLR